MYLMPLFGLKSSLKPNENTQKYIFFPSVVSKMCNPFVLSQSKIAFKHFTGVGRQISWSSFFFRRLLCVNRFV